jgi:hypothetical protein
MHVWLRALRRLESTMPCIPWRVMFPSSSNVWKALESCSSCLSCTQLDMIRKPKVCPCDIRHCLRIYPCPKCRRCPPPFVVAAFLPSFLILHRAGYPKAFHRLLTFLHDQPSGTPMLLSDTFTPPITSQHGGWSTKHVVTRIYCVPDPH